VNITGTLLRNTAKMSFFVCSTVYGGNRVFFQHRYFGHPDLGGTLQFRYLYRIWLIPFCDNRDRTFTNGANATSVGSETVLDPHQTFPRFMCLDPI
jgi:hypothetical protein